jgi:hypothetical protein
MKEEFHIRKREVEVEVDLRQEGLEIRRPDKARGRRCLIGVDSRNVVEGSHAKEMKDE